MSRFVRVFYNKVVRNQATGELMEKLTTDLAPFSPNGTPYENNSSYDDNFERFVIDSYECGFVKFDTARAVSILQVKEWEHYLPAEQNSTPVVTPPVAQNATSPVAQNVSQPSRQGSLPPRKPYKQHASKRYKDRPRRDMRDVKNAPAQVSNPQAESKPIPPQSEPNPVPEQPEQPEQSEQPPTMPYPFKE